MQVEIQEELHRIDSVLQTSHSAILQACEHVRKQYPDSFYEDTVRELRKEFLQRLNDKYHKASSFTEKKKIAEQIGGWMEYVARKPIRYEQWITPYTVELFKKYGFRETLRRNLLII